MFPKFKDKGVLLSLGRVALVMTIIAVTLLPAFPASVFAQGEWRVDSSRGEQARGEVDQINDRETILRIVNERHYFQKAIARSNSMRNIRALAPDSFVKASLVFPEANHGWRTALENPAEPALAPFDVSGDWETFAADIAFAAFVSLLELIPFPTGCLVTPFLKSTDMFVFLDEMTPYFFSVVGNLRAGDMAGATSALSSALELMLQNLPSQVPKLTLSCLADAIKAAGALVPGVGQAITAAKIILKLSPMILDWIIYPKATIMVTFEYVPPRPTPTPVPTRTATPVPPRPTSTPVPRAILGDRLALALYFPWYDQNTWTICARYSQPAERYSSSDPRTISRQISEGKAAGLNGFISSYLGPRGENPTEANLKKLLDEAGRQNFKIGVALETNYGDFFPNLESQKAALRQVISVHSKHPAYLRIQGKPAIVIWRPREIFKGGTRIGKDGPDVIAAWQSLIAELDPNRSMLWIAEGDYTPLLQAFDGIFPFSIAWSPDPAAQLRSYASRARAYPGKLWLAIAMPGYDDRCTQSPQSFVVDRANGAYMRRTLEGALATDPDALIVVSYNEWVEGHAIETGAQWGNLYLTIVRQFIDNWRQR